MNTACKQGYQEVIVYWALYTGYVTASAQLIWREVGFYYILIILTSVELSS